MYSNINFFNYQSILEIFINYFFTSSIYDTYDIYLYICIIFFNKNEEVNTLIRMINYDSNRILYLRYLH